MEVRPIDANALDTNDLPAYYGSSVREEDVQEWINDAPTLDYAPVRHGEWIRMVDAITNRKAGYKCSECGLILRKNYEYCNCGAKMDGGKDHV